MSIDTVIFDIGGVLVQGASVGALLRGAGIQYGECEREYWQRVKTGQISEDNFFRALLNDDSLARVAKEDMRKYVQGAQRGPACELAFKVQELGVHRGIISNHVAPWAYGSLKAVGVDKVFEGFPVLISDEVRLAKPDRRIYELALERLDRPAERCVFIDDKQKNVDAARELGMQAVLCKEKETVYLSLRALGLEV